MFYVFKEKLKKMRIAVCGLGSENCTFSPIQTLLSDFRINDTAELLTARFQHLVEDNNTNGGSECEFVWILAAGAMPGGPIHTEGV